MEFKELATCQFIQNAIHSFNLVSSGFHVGMLGSTSKAIVFEMKHSTLPTQSFPYRVEIVELPTVRPTSEVVNKMNRAAIYLKSSALKRQYIALDPVYVSDLSEEPIKSQPVDISWAPRSLFDESTLAIVSSNGACELRRKDSISREWNIAVCRLNDIYHEAFSFQNPEAADTFETLKETVENYFTTAFSWNMSPNLQHLFAAANATGWILLFMVNKDRQISFSSKYKTSLGRISCVYFINNFIIASSANGVIKIYTVNGTIIEEVDTLWHKADRIPCKKLHMCFSDELDKWIIVTSKASHVLIFILTRMGMLELKGTQYLGNMEITGFEMLSPCEYVFVTITGLVQLIKLNIKYSKLQINVQDMKYEFDHKNYQILGLVSSPNKVAWTFMLFHNKPYTYQSTYSAKDAIISICSLNTKDAFTILKDDLGSRDDSLDCAEILQLEIFKNNVTSKFENVSIDDVIINRQFFKKLQLKLLVVNAGLTYHSSKYNHIKKTVTNEVNSLIRITECVFINLRLQFLRSLKAHTEFQLLSGKCMKYKLKSLQAELISKEDIFRNVQENINTLSDCLLMDLGSLFDTAKENCKYCDQPVDFTTLMCSSLHSVSRCSISYLQVPLFSRVQCTSCNRLYLDDIELLKSLFVDPDDMKCTFCGFLLEFDMKETFNAIEM